MSREAHRPVPGWPGYFASADGQVWSVRRVTGAYLPLRPFPDRKGYPTVAVNKPDGGKRTSKKVHRLVALAFCGSQPSPAHEVRHLDGNNANNRADNLAWGTRAENAADREAHGRTSRGERHSEAIKRGFDRAGRKPPRRGYTMNLSAAERERRAEQMREIVRRREAARAQARAAIHSATGEG